MKLFPHDQFLWHAIRCRSRSEKLAAHGLIARDFEVLPALAPQRRIWADRVRTVEMPLFPGYIFARFSFARRVEVERVAGVASVVRFGDECCPVQDGEIDAVRLVLGSGLEVQRAPFLSVGKSVAVKHGPLAGARGHILAVKNQYRLVVNVTLLQRSVAVEIDEAMVEPLWNSSESSYDSPIKAA
jgi:transcription antitermination factor NusG